MLGPIFSSKFAKNYGINVIPVDYAAKLMWEIMNHPVQSDETCFHITNPVNINHREYLTMILKSLKIKDFTFVDEAPDRSTYNEFEKLYYNIIDPVFNDYLTKGEWLFDQSNV